MSLFDNLVRYGMPFVPKPIIGKVAKRYVAGEEVSDAVRTIRELNEEGAMATVDVLGEEVHDPARAQTAVDQYLGLLETIDTESLDANVSIKPTMLGLKIDQALCEENLAAIAGRASELDSFVRIDMEDHTCTDDTLEFFRRLREEFPGHVGVVLQSYLRRTLDDIEALSDGLLHFRLCKGIYNEPREIAYKDMTIINRSFVCCLEMMFEKGAYVGIATHDEKLIFESLQLIRKYRLQRDDYEFQMLLGVDQELRDLLVKDGHRLRVYVPFGKSWLPYSKRRLKENPSIAQHALRQMLGMKSKSV